MKETKNKSQVLDRDWVAYDRLGGHLFGDRDSWIDKKMLTYHTRQQAEALSN